MGAALKVLVMLAGWAVPGTSDSEVVFRPGSEEADVPELFRLPSATFA